MNMTEQTIEYLKELTAIPSPSGFTKDAAAYCYEQLEAVGFRPQFTEKGGVLCELCEEYSMSDLNDGLLITAHIDTLGGMVKEIKSNGRLRISPIGGLQPHNTEGENCTIYTREYNIYADKQAGKGYSGTFQLDNPSVHVNKDYGSTVAERSFDTMEIVVDEVVKTKEDTIALGISVGDYVCFDPRTTVTQSGYIKSRFLDDKLSVAMLLAYAADIAQRSKNGDVLKRRVVLHITVYEEVGHGGAAVPNGISDMLCVDMGCVGGELTCDERMVSICAKDSRGPYDYDITTNLISAAKQAGLNYAVDVYPYYGSDADAALGAGNDIRHGLIGAGVYASHGYERSHIDGVKNTVELIKAYVDFKGN